jgi:hypothetical protein
VQDGWIATTHTEFTVILAAGQEYEASPDEYFGNVKIGCYGGGHTPGFWANQNGYATIVTMGLESVLAQLGMLPLVDAAGSDFDPSTYDEFAAWLLACDASENMAYKLSVHYACMKLNVWAGFVDLGALVYAPDYTGEEGLDALVPISELLSAAESSLALDKLTPPDDPNRDVQEVIKDALDAANNNDNFLCLTPDSPTEPPEEEEEVEIEVE